MVICPRTLHICNFQEKNSKGTSGRIWQTFIVVNFITMENLRISLIRIPLGNFFLKIVICSVLRHITNVPNRQIVRHNPAPPTRLQTQPSEIPPFPKNGNIDLPRSGKSAIAFASTRVCKLPARVVAIACNCNHEC